MTPSKEVFELMTKVLTFVVFGATGWLFTDYMAFKADRHQYDLKATQALTTLTLEVRALKNSSIDLDRDVRDTNSRITTFSSSVNGRFDKVDDELHDLEMKLPKQFKTKGE